MKSAFVHSLLAAVAILVSLPAGAETKRELIVAEPLHGTGYLPLYVAAGKGFFDQEGIAIKILTVESGAGHTNAVLTGQAFAFIGGPEHDAFAKAKGAELRSVVNVVNRGNVYLVAATGMEPPKDVDWPTYMKGKTIVSGFYGGTPNSITRYLLGKWKLDFKTDVTVMETTSAAGLAALKTKQAQIAVVTEPFIAQGERQGIWGEPIYNVPKELGPYAYSTLNVRYDSIQKDPALVQSFVKAVMRGLKATYEDPAGAMEIAHKEFPTMSADDLKATIDRSLADQMWSKDGMVTPEAWSTAQSVVRDAGILKSDVPYEAIIDMQFVKAAQAGGM
jgi:NitT/TauT family transport system substrate-binding protein